MKIVYIAHPIKGDIKANIQKILNIIREVNLTEENILPFAPYLNDVQAMNDNIPEERARGMRNNKEFFYRSSIDSRLRIVDELWLCGTHISEGMLIEINLAVKYDIPIVWKIQSLEINFAVK